MWLCLRCLFNKLPVLSVPASAFLMIATDSVEKIITLFGGGTVGAFVAGPIEFGPVEEATEHAPVHGALAAGKLRSQERA